jgi:DNA-binding transcriptional MerR regulator
VDEKSPDAFRTISEAAEELGLPQHVLRFWESKFREIKPMKRGGGRRFYRPDDLDLLRGIKHLLYGEGYTIRGVQRILREQGLKFVQAVWEEGAEQPPHRVSAEEEFEDAAETEVLAEDERDGLGSRIGSLIGRDLNARPAPPIGRREPPLTSAPLPRLSEADRAMHAEPAIHAPHMAPPAKALTALPANGLDAEQLRSLRDALRELRECRALIDATIAPAE